MKSKIIIQLPLPTHHPRIQQPLLLNPQMNYMTDNCYFLSVFHLMIEVVMMPWLKLLKVKLWKEYCPDILKSFSPLLLFSMEIRNMTKFVSNGWKMNELWYAIATIKLTILLKVYYLRYPPLFWKLFIHPCWIVRYINCRCKKPLMTKMCTNK